MALQNISTMSEEELVKLKEYLIMTKDSLGTKKEKLLTLFSGIAGLTVVGTGVAIAILFPNPVTIAVLGGLAVLSNKTMKPKKSLRKIKEKSMQKETVKSDLTTVESRLSEIKIEMKIRGSMYPSLNPNYEK